MFYEDDFDEWYPNKVTILSDLKDSERTRLVVWENDMELADTGRRQGATRELSDEVDTHAREGLG